MCSTNLRFGISDLRSDPPILAANPSGNRCNPDGVNEKRARCSLWVVTLSAPHLLEFVARMTEPGANPKQRRVPGRPGPDSTLDDVRQRLVDAGIDLLLARGVEVGLGHLSLSDAIGAAGVTRSTAYRSLSDDELAPQAVLHRELLTYILSRYSRTASMASMRAEVDDELERQAKNVSSTDQEDRVHAMRAIIRVGANASYANMIRTPERAILSAIASAMRSSGVDDWRLDALIEGETALLELFVELYGGLAELFGYRLKPPLTIGQFTTAGISLIEGIGLRHGINPELQIIERPTGFGDATESWTLFAVAFEALFLGFFEPIEQTKPA